MKRDDKKTTREEARADGSGQAKTKLQWLTKVFEETSSVYIAGKMSYFISAVTRHGCRDYIDKI